MNFFRKFRIGDFVKVDPNEYLLVCYYNNGSVRNEQIIGKVIDFYRYLGFVYVQIGNYTADIASFEIKFLTKATDEDLLVQKLRNNDHLLNSIKIEKVNNG